MEICSVGVDDIFFHKYCIMKNYVCLTGRVLMFWGVVGLELVLILRLSG